MPNSFLETPDGLLLVASGFDKMLVWDGLAQDASLAGVPAPSAKPTINASGVGAIAGEYTAYLRYKDADGNVSNLSPVSTAITASTLSGTINSVTAGTPVSIQTVGNHGLDTGDTVFIQGILGIDAANDTFVITVTGTNTFTLDDSQATGTYAGGGTWHQGAEKILYSAVEVPTDPRVVKRQLLRNTAGQATTYYVDIETTDLTSTTFESTRLDTDLADQTSQVILNIDGTPLANRNAEPPDHRAFLAHHLDRVFAAGEVQYKEGNVSLTQGSTAVTGIGTEWTDVLPGRFLWVRGATREYEIESVDTANQTLVLTEAYEDATEAFAVYAIRPPSSYRKQVWYSEAGKPLSWSALNAFTLQDDGDEITGLVQHRSYLYILEKRHTYRFSFQENPAKDGFVFLAANRGCINHRSWVVVEGTLYMLDEAGVYAFDGGREAENISDVISDIFEPSGRDEDLRINWRASNYFHAQWYPGEGTIRWFVSLKGQSLPYHALAFSVRQRRWWVEEFSRPMPASCQGLYGGERRLYLGSLARKVFLFDEGHLDGPDAREGTVTGTATSATLTSLTDTSADFASAGLVGSAIAIVQGKGKGQRRIITEVSGTRINVDRPWLNVPDTTSVYQIGGMAYQYRTGWFRWLREERENVRRVEVVFQSSSFGIMNAQMYLDHDEDNPFLWGKNFSSSYTDGIKSEQDEAKLELDLTKASGFVQWRMDGHKDIYADGPRFVSFDFSGEVPDGGVRVYEITVDGVV